MKTVVIIMLFLTFIKTSHAQTNTDIALYNIGLGGIGAGIGAVINKSTEEKIGRVFLKGLWQGSIGGGLVFTSKTMIRELAVEGKLEYAWPAKLTHAAGTSIIENAAHGRPMLSQWHLHIGFNRLEIETRDKIKVHYKILPISLFLTGYSAIDRRPEWLLMLETGEIIFSANKKDLGSSRGTVLGNIMILRKSSLERQRESNNYPVLGHELIHIYQYYDYNFVNTYTSKPLNNWARKSTAFKKLNSLFYWDFQAPVLRGLYLLEEININNKFDNFFEYEAEFFSDPDNLRQLGF